MSTQVERAHGLEALGIVRSGPVHWNLSPAVLYEIAIRRNEAILASEGPLVARTGQHTGRSPQDKFTVKEPTTEQNIAWGTLNRPITEANFDALHRDMMTYVQDKELYVLDAWGGADPAYRLPVRVVTEFAWHNLFARNMFIPETDPGKCATHRPEYTVIDCPGLKADPARHGSRTETAIYVHFGRKLVLIAGTNYAGEIKKSIFTILNYTLPLKGVLSMHCSANVGRDGDSALFFGLSGTGKTTLSSDPERGLIGDDEHGWSERGIFNFEGGCYAKVIKLSKEAEPQIWDASRRFGTILENVVLDPDTRDMNLDDMTYTENTRSSYPLGFIPNAIPSGQAGHPKNVVMLTADAYGAMPPIARLTPEGAMYHFLSGYTARVAGTEKGVTEPKATFSTCFGAPFLPLDPSRYARMLGERIAKHGARVWLLNTGWTGGPYGVGRRMQIAYTRAMIRAALSGALDTASYQKDAVFNLDIPQSCPGVPPEVLNPRSTWSDTVAYDAQAAKLARMFADNFKTFEATVDAKVRRAGPTA
ncbi:MAG TPA: phosphoenolpyruvate carboxykinase [Vicinamibacterales bacterium]|nr:phosphoenolpyruvate carboxykinase [Vicinamibacterales bacterium]